MNAGFKIPENYFDDFSEKVMQKLPENKPKVISIFAKRKTWLYAAAAVLVASLTIPIATRYNTQSRVLDQATLENYLTVHADFSDDELVELLSEEDIEKIKLDYPIEDQTVEDILSTNTDLEEYISN